jgi:hypothetical protein
MSLDLSDDAPSAAPVGRGRGRGQAILPAGLWSELNSSSGGGGSGQSAVELESGQFSDATFDDSSMPTGFGSSNGQGRDRMGGRGRGRGSLGTPAGR